MRAGSGLVADNVRLEQQAAASIGSAHVAEDKAVLLQQELQRER